MKHYDFNGKSDYVKAFETMCTPLKNYYSEGRALVNIGCTAAHFGERTVGLEGFSRILWGLVPLWAGGQSSCLDPYITEGIIHGTDPDHEEYWGAYKDGEQAYVEMAALAYGLLLAPERVWEPLSEKEQDRFADWLGQINSHRISDNNWLFFRVLVNCGLRRVHAGFSEKQLEQDLNRIDEFYLGDGWYSDGMTAQRDYYVGFAMHFYSLIYVKLMAEEDPERCARYKERSILFARSFIYWFGERGEALPYGRSLTYRFAQVSFWCALAFAEVEAMPWGVIKGIVNRHFRYWFSRPMLDCEGKLTLGYGYPNLNVCEGYLSPNSPYWSFKSFLVLALPEDHPFWSAEELPLPKLESVKFLPHAGMMIGRTGDGYTTALVSGQYSEWEPVHCAERYEKFAYSSYFGFCVPRAYYNLAQAAPDNMLAFLKDGYYHVRRRCISVMCDETKITSRWSPLKGVLVETELLFSGKGHIRTHVIHADQPYTVVEGGFGIPYREPGEVNTDGREGFASVSGPGGFSLIRLCEGTGQGNIIFCEANVNLLYPRTVLPYLQYEILEGTTTITVYVEGIPGNEK